MDALLHSNRAPEPHETRIISVMMKVKRESINNLDINIDQLEQDAEVARQRVQRLTVQLEAETRGLRLYEDAILELKTTRNALAQSIERKKTILSSRRRIPGDVWRTIFLLLWETEFRQRNESNPPFSVALQVGAVCREWRDLAQTTATLWSVLDYTFSQQKMMKSRKDNKLSHYLDHIGTATPYITLRKACNPLLPAAICQVTTATELTILLEHPVLRSGYMLDFPISPPFFSHLCTLTVASHQHILIIFSDILRLFPSLNNLCLRNVVISWLQPIVPHINLKALSIGGTWEVLHPWTSAIIDIAMVAELFSDLTDLKLDCGVHISTPQVVFHHVQNLYIRSSAINNVDRLTPRVSFPNLYKITNIGKDMKGLTPIVQAWGESVGELALSGIEPYDGSSQHLSEILDDSGSLPRLSRLAFLNITQVGTIDLALVADAVVRRHDLAANRPAQLNRIETITLPIIYNSDRNLESLKRCVAVQWQ